MSDLQTAVSGINAVEKEMNEVVIDQPTLVREVLLAILSRGHLLALGERGVAKTFAVDVFMAHMDSDVKKFYALCSKSMDPQLLVGNLSPKKLIEDDVLAYNIEGKLPDVHVATLDEIFKNNAPNLNMLLAIMNERKFVTNGHTHICPLWSLIGTSNLDEYQVTGELAAFRDRFGSALLVERVGTKDGFMRILDGQVDRFASNSTLPAQATQLTLADIELLQQATRDVTLPAAVREAIADMRERAAAQSLIPSDRRYGQLVQRMCAQAVMNGRAEVRVDDLVLAQHTLWTELADKPLAYELIMDYAGQAVSTASKLRKTIAPVIESFNEWEAQVDADAGPTNEQFGQLGRMMTDTKKIVDRIDEAMATAEKSGEDTTDLTALKKDAGTVRAAVEKHLGL